MGFGLFLSTSSFVHGAAAGSLISDLKSDEQIVFYPTLAAPATNGAWEVHVHGCVFEVEKRHLSLAVLRGILRLDGVRLGDQESAIFKERGRLFLADNERGHRVVGRIGEAKFDLGKSAPNGHFEKRLHLEALPALVVPASAGLSNNAMPLPNPNKQRLRAGPDTFEISAVLKPGDARSYTGTIMPLTATGLSVISDLDDTIKVSEVRDHDALIRRTFLKPFEAVPGMAELYRAWATNGAQFHYVTASPWQLHMPLVEFAASNAFPAGSWHMKSWRLKDRTFRSLFEDPGKYKVESISPLLRQFPQRRFVFVGDSGERDPEAYAALARQFPKQVAAIYIRDVTGEAPGAERYRTNFADLSPELWRIFTQPSELPRNLPK